MTTTDELPVADPTVAQRFLAELYRDIDTGWLTLFTVDRATGEIGVQWAPVDDQDQLVDAAMRASDRCCVWFGVATRQRRLPRGRGGAEDCAQLTALWLDLDVAGPAHDRDDLPPDYETAVRIVDRFPLQPTALVASGHGLQAWWALDEPLDAEDAGELLERWHLTWERHGQPHHVDNVFDVPRIMRLPGTLNRKLAPQPVEILEQDWDRRYSVGDLAELLDDLPAPAAAREIRWTGDEGLPGQVFNQRHSAGEILTSLGFTPARGGRDHDNYTRPGKTNGTSVSVYHDDGHATVWSDTVTGMWPALQTRRPYDPFGLYACTHHGGDFTAAAVELERRGYGTRGFDEIEVLALEPGSVPVPPEPAEVAGDDNGWDFVDLGAILDGNYDPPTPTICTRSDGVGLFYPGRVHSLAGEPGGGKTWLALHVAADIIRSGGTAALIDYEDTPAAAVSRLLALGLDPDDIRRGFTYIRPTGPLMARGKVDVATAQRLDALEVDLVVIDSVGESLAVEGLGPNDDDAVTQWFRLLPRKLARAGAAVLGLDHVTKSKEDRGMWAIGSQRKLAGIDGAAYGVEVKVAPTKTKDGKLTLICAKDRHGTHQRGHQVAVVDIANTDTGGVVVTLQAPQTTFRPTYLMERVSRFLEDYGEASARVITKTVTGKTDHIRAAIDVLVEEEYVAKTVTERGNSYRSVVTFRENSAVEPLVDDHRAPPRPTAPREDGARFQGPPDEDRAPRAPDPLRSRGPAGARSEALDDDVTDLFGATRAPDHGDPAA